MSAGGRCKSSENASNVAVWALLVGGIGIVEREQAIRGSKTPHFDAMLGNVSRLLAIALKWGIKHGPLSARREGSLALGGAS